VEFVKPTSTDVTNLKASTSFISKEDPHTSHLKNEEIDATLNVAREKNNHEDNVNADNLVNQEKDCSVDSTHCSSEETVKKNCPVDDKNLNNTCVDKSPSRRKKNVITFDNNKYENLSQETDYEVPRLKILGKIDTEFKFTSMLYINYVKHYVY